VFLLTANRRENVLVAEVGFPPEQHRLRIDGELGHPGWMVKHQRPLLLANTDLDAEFRQILKTARMGSVLLAPMRFNQEFLGSLVLASQARHTYTEDDLEALVAFAGLATAVFCAYDGPAWFRTLG
jgi:GAF domain-containing protein